MALLDRFNVSTVVDPDDPEQNKISGGQFMSALTEWALGHYSRANVINAFNISATDESDLDWLKARYDNATQKERFLIVVRNQFYLLEGGYETAARVQTRILDASNNVNMG